MKESALFNEVKAFAQKQGLLNKRISKSLLNDKFGKTNVIRLIDKSYLISIGKDVTFGNG